MCAVGHASSMWPMRSRRTLVAGHFNAALLTDHTAVFQALVLTAQALIIFYRPKDTGAEKAVTLRLERTVVNGFRLCFTERP